MKILLGDLNGIVGREDIFKPTILANKAAHYHTLHRKLRASSLTRDLGGLLWRWPCK
jgi:hypothetical protein